MNLTLEIKDLRKQNDEKDKKIQALENRLADLEQYTRLNDLIITGLDVKPRTYARAVVPDVEPNEKDLESVEQQVQGRNLKGTNVYINEHLTKKNADIAKQARLLRKQNKIQATWTSNCRVFIKLNGIPELAKVLWIKDINELDTYST
ncbi:hypothetical protein WMY93_011341 [Mugilogobius chulae]|uniref:Uncharacterized protein n=1 Tax=Mugilogobius chulae TaxID=88201 RepID=A0AAW0P2J3_9GOBI